MRRPDILHVPVGDHLRPVGVDRGRHDADHVVEHPLGFLVGAVQAVVDELGRGLRRRHFARVQRERLDDDGAGLGHDLACLGLREPARVGQARVELLELIELGQVGRRRDEERQIRTALARLPELHQLHLVGALREQLVGTRAACPSSRACGRPPSGSRRTAPATAERTAAPTVPGRLGCRRRRRAGGARPGLGQSGRDGAISSDTPSVGGRRSAHRTSIPPCASSRAVCPRALHRRVRRGRREILWF